MTVLEMNRGSVPAKTLIDDAIAQYGAIRVLLTAVRALLRARRLRRERPPDVNRLDSRMRRDIGLLPDVDRTDWRFL